MTSIKLINNILKSISIKTYERRNKTKQHGWQSGHSLFFFLLGGTGNSWSCPLALRRRKFPKESVFFGANRFMAIIIITLAVFTIFIRRRGQVFRWGKINRVRLPPPPPLFWLGGHGQGVRRKIVVDTVWNLEERRRPHTWNIDHFHKLYAHSLSVEDDSLNDCPSRWCGGMVTGWNQWRRTVLNICLKIFKFQRFVAKCLKLISKTIIQIITSGYDIKLVWRHVFSMISSIITDLPQWRQCSIILYTLVLCIPIEGPPKTSGMSSVVRLWSLTRSTLYPAV